MKSNIYDNEKLYLTLIKGETRKGLGFSSAVDILFADKDHLTLFVVSCESAQIRHTHTFRLRESYFIQYLIAIACRLNRKM